MFAVLTLKEKWLRTYPWLRHSGAGSRAELAALGARTIVRPWVARIVGPDVRYGLAREFVNSFHDYRDASRSGRGMLHVFFLRDGLYEVFEIVSTKHRARYFLWCANGRPDHISENEAFAWLGLSPPQHH